MLLSDIVIQPSFAETTPYYKKVQWCEDYFKHNSRVDRDIVVDENNVLVDGYIGYLVLKQNGVENYDVCRIDSSGVRHKCSTIYVFGTHKKDGVEYCWRVSPRTTGLENMAVGNRAIVRTKYGRKTINITRIEECESVPVDTKVKRVYFFIAA